ncbi:MAG: hypothetical protein JO115_04960 [Pseudonocardiales bacterium]|nr:hypothetical protein [Pseudonocardiales bacterium]
MLAHTTATTTVHDRIVEVVRRLGGDTNVCCTTIEVIPASEPNRLADALAAIVPARIILTSTLERRLLLAKHHGAVGWTVADLAGQPHRTRVWLRCPEELRHGKDRRIGPLSDQDRI